MVHCCQCILSCCSLRGLSGDGLCFVCQFSPPEISCSVQCGNLMFARSNSKRLSQVRLITLISCAEVECLQFSAETVQRQFSVGDRHRKPVAENWFTDSRTYLASVSLFVPGTTVSPIVIGHRYTVS